MPPVRRRPETLGQAIGDGPARLLARDGERHLSASHGCLVGLDGASILLRTRGQLAAALGLIALDGVARRIVIAPPDVKDDHLPSVIARAQIDVTVSDDAALAVDGTRFVELVPPGPRTGIVAATPSAPPPERKNAGRQTEWVLFTSGTTGEPKMVAHTLSGLTGAIGAAATPDAVWGTFYDIRRYGGLQILLRALLGRAPLILSDADEDLADLLIRLGRHGVTHLTGTPSHWRRVLMSPAGIGIAPRYVRLSGEIADQAVLDALKARFPDAAIGHAYASTEAGVGFEVTDGLEGFPADLLGRSGPVEMKVEEGRLYLRSPRTASAYVGGGPPLQNDGWVDSGDLVERRGDRFHFLGRAGGIINVGGLKINPEEVEAVINRQPGVRASRVSGRKSPITGAIVMAEVVPADPANNGAVLRDAILASCRAALPPFKVPAILHFVPALALTAGGKLSRARQERHA